MGGEVPRVPERPAVAPGRAAPAEGKGFGRWYRTQRELRGVAADYVAHRTKLAPQRIDAIERDEGLLRADGQGRMTARALAEAIGADSDEAVRVLVEFAEAAREPAPRFARVSARGAMLALALLVLGGGSWWLVDALLTMRASGSRFQVIHRPDYVQRALDGER